MIEAARQVPAIRVILKLVPDATGMSELHHTAVSFRCEPLATAQALIMPPPRHYRPGLDAVVLVTRAEAQRNTDTDSIWQVLQTSGTSGKRKVASYIAGPHPLTCCRIILQVVPHTLRNLLVGSLCIARSWVLTPNDSCLNMMPLFHIGGISRR